jgi:hypothetical protein
MTAPSLDLLAKQINDGFKQIDCRRIEFGRKLIQARELVDNGWEEWCAKNIANRCATFVNAWHWHGRPILLRRWRPSGDIFGSLILGQDFFSFSTRYFAHGLAGLRHLPNNRGDINVLPCHGLTESIAFSGSRGRNKSGQTR